MYRVGVAVSGRGSNLAALLRTLEDEAAVKVVAVFSHTPDAGGVALARSSGIPTVIFADPSDASAWLAALRAYQIDLLVLAGFLKLIPSDVVLAWRGRIINIHPALLPRHGGPGMYGLRVHRAVLEAGDRETGATVHLVDEQYDRGDVLAQARVPVQADDTPESLAERVLSVEHQLLPAAVLAAARAGQPVPFNFAMESTR